MVEATKSSKPRDVLLEKLRERIKERDRALEVNPSQNFTVASLKNNPKILLVLQTSCLSCFIYC